MDGSSSELTLSKYVEEISLKLFGSCFSVCVLKRNTSKSIKLLSGERGKSLNEIYRSNGKKREKLRPTDEKEAVLFLKPKSQTMKSEARFGEH